MRRFSVMCIIIFFFLTKGIFFSLCEPYIHLFFPLVDDINDDRTLEKHWGRNERKKNCKRMPQKLKNVEMNINVMVNERKKESQP